MICTISIKEAAKFLNYKDHRSVYRWCRNNGVKIFSYVGSKRRDIIKTEFENAKSKSVIKYLSQKYGREKLPELFNARMNFSSEHSIATENKMLNKEKIKEYTPQLPNELRFMSILSTLISEL